ncbi:MAG TPA: phosphoserine phosphatase [Thermoanaerobacter sp.]|jgi:2,3-diketo-5-methylthio-1-phosphopentane phosphatase|nr:phosphoserine phosphatase [Thermoanaerobacter sp.]
MKKVFLVDFDGTVTKVDTVDLMVKKFAKDGWQYYEELWEKGEMSTEECAIETLKLMEVDEKKLLDLLYTIEIDDYFMEFLNFCRTKDYEVVIVSDGYDFNIKAIMDKYGFNIKFYSNKLWFEDGIIKVDFPHKSKDCNKCGMCKLEVLNRYKIRGYYVVYIGDGYSDFCVSQHADKVFAKGVLEKYCKENEIPCTPFRNFGDIIEKLKR